MRLDREAIEDVLRPMIDEAVARTIAQLPVITQSPSAEWPISPPAGGRGIFFPRGR